MCSASISGANKVTETEKREGVIRELMGLNMHTKQIQTQQTR